jgi:hypothetical protein
MRILLLAVLLVAAQAPPPASEIFLVTMKPDGESIRLGEPVNISDSAGYDNQPFFTPDGAVLFTSARNRVVSVAPAEAPPPVQMDIYRYDIEAKQLRQVTSTLQSEYSPTVMPGGKGISVIRVEDDGTQRLWRFGLDGGSPSVILEDVKPVGYHAWIDDHHVALFVLGQGGQPATLQLADSRTGKAEVVATDIGRSIQRMPSGAISFVQREKSAAEKVARLTVRAFNPSAAGAGRVTTLVAVPDGVTQPDLAWMPDGGLLLAHEGRLLRWREGASGWAPVANLAGRGLEGATRLAVSPDGTLLAVVADGR